MPGVSRKASWGIYLALLLVFLTLYFAYPFEDGGRRMLGTAFLLTVVLVRWLVVDKPNRPPAK